MRFGEIGHRTGIRSNTRGTATRLLEVADATAKDLADSDDRVEKRNYSEQEKRVGPVPIARRHYIVRRRDDDISMHMCGSVSFSDQQ